MKNKIPVSGIIFAILGLGSVVGVLSAFVSDKIFLCVFFAVLAVVFISATKTAFSKFNAKSDSDIFLKYGKEAKKVVDSVLAKADIQEICDSKEFNDNGVKVVVIDNNKKVSLVLTDKCIYEGVFGSYDFPGKGIKNISFIRGQQIVGQQRVMMDEDKMARDGFFAGGLGVAAMNAASAREANAQGGALVGVNSGFFPLLMKVRSEESHVYVTIIRKDYIEKFGNISEDCYVREGKFYNVYYNQSFKGGGRCKEAADKLSELLIKIQQA